MKKILVFSGAGVSKESGLDTFRDSDGLWNNYKVEDVATIEAWNKDPQRVIDFYNSRRAQMLSAFPNDAHKIISYLQKYFHVTVCTQNVDNLHEMAGSTNVIHLHGEITKLKSDYDHSLVKPYTNDLMLGDTCPNGGQWRPDVVLFGENLDYSKVDDVRSAAIDATVCVIVGTSMRVSPANMIPWMTNENCIIYYIDPSEIDFQIPRQRKPFFYHIKKVATEGMKEFMDDIKSYLI